MTAPYQQNQAKERGKAIPTRGVLNLNSSNKQLMRIIKFRGKRLDNGAWETGGFVELLGSDMPHNHYVIDKRNGHHTPVIPETVGQFTGLLDKNGTEIYEGDIIYESIDGINTDWVVRYDVSLSEYRAENVGDEGDDIRLGDVWKNKSEVFDNIHDNHKLLKTK